MAVEPSLRWRGEPARQAEVLAMARTVFHEQGFAATSTRELAGRLGILGGSLYYYIESKQSLLHEILDGAQAGGRVALAEAQAASGPALDRLRTLMAAHVEEIVEDPVGIALVFSELSALRPELREAIADDLSAYRQGFAALMAESQREGTGRSDLDAGIATNVMLGTLNWTHRWYRPGGRHAPARVVAELSSVLLDGLAAPGAPTTLDAGHERWLEAALAPPEPVGRERRASELMCVAAELFFERGFQATTTTEIAERLGLRKASLYHYMSSKEDLLYTLTSDVQQRSVDTLDALVATDLEPLGKLQAAIRFHVAYLTGNLTRTSVLLHQLRSLAPEHRGLLVALQRRYAAGFVTLIVGAQRAGAVRADLDPEIAGFAVLGAVNWPYRWYRASGVLSPQDIAAATSDVLLGGWAAR
jgi:AcrR family transcriptional regulator